MVLNLLVVLSKCVVWPEIELQVIALSTTCSVFTSIVPSAREVAGIK